MNPGRVGRLIFLCGLLALYVFNVYADQDLELERTKKSESKENKAHQRLTGGKVTYNDLSRYLFKRLDASCDDTPPPDVLNAKFVRFKNAKITDGKSKTKEYTVAIYRCEEGFKFRNSPSGKMFCSKGKWVGRKPVCDRIRTNIDSLQGDDPGATPPLGPASEKCPTDFEAQCQHVCRIQDGQPTCFCLPGFKKDGNDCKDVDECQTNNGGCFHSCTNTPGSFSCSCPTGFRLSSDGKTCDDVNECHLRNGHGPCQDTCENTLGSYRCGCSNLKGTRLAPDLHTCSDVNECTEGSSGCSHSCINTHSRAFCTCPEGMELGSDWRTCHDINECDDPEITSTCKFGCINFIGSYYCAKHSNDTLSDQPVVDNETVPNEGEDYGGEEEEESYSDYEDEDYDDDDEEEYDEREAVAAEENKMKVDSTTVASIEKGLDVELPVIQNRIDEESEKNYVEEKETVTRESSLAETTIRTNESEKTKGDVEDHTRSENSDEYDDYDDEYDYEEGGKENNIHTTSKSNERPIDGYEIFVPIVKEEEKGENTSPLPIHTTINTDKIIDNRNYDEQEPEVDKYITSTYGYGIDHTIPEIPKKEIENKLDEGYDEHEEGSKKENDLLPTETSFIDHNATDPLKENDTKESGDEDDENYDGDYDEEDYDDSYDQDLSDKKTTTIIPIKVTNDSSEAEREHIKKIVAKLPEVDIEKVNTDIHQIIANNTDSIDEDGGEATTVTSSSSSMPEETTESSSEKNVDDDEDDQDGEGDKEPKKEQSVPAEKEIVKCDIGYTVGEDGDCTDRDECQSDPSPCSNGCQNTIGSYLCTCPSGFTLSPSDPHSCEDIDECVNQPCSHTCINEIGNYRCACPTGLTLQNTTCVNLTCSQGQTKVNGVVQCTCLSGYVLGEDQRSCEDVDECQFGHGCSHLCRNTIGSYECGCEAGFELENERTCVDIDECKSSHGCPQICKNLPGSFECTCEDGFDYHNENNTCEDINECDEALDLDECGQICVNYEGGYECACNPGYTLAEDNATCEDVDECADNNGNCTQTCINLPGTYQCGCKIGYALSIDNRTCELTDPCVVENGGCSHTCVNDNGVAVCKCPEGQVLVDKDCYKIDPCVASNGGCSHICVNANGAVRCECPEGHELENATTCVQINLCTINNGNCSHFCEFVDGHVNCMCPDMHVLENKTQCVEIDPCLENNGGCSHICTFSNHTVACSCPPSHELRNETHCFEKTPCLTDNGGCSDICDYNNGTVTCSCPDNYYLQGKTCYRIDPCLTDNGGCSHECSSNEKGEVECSCPENFELRADNKTCAPKNPCLVNNGGCSHKCSAPTGKVVCHCPKGFKLKNKTHCERSNPCLIENGGCSHFCENVRGEAMCSCPKNYVLRDSKLCIPYDPCQDDNGGCSHICKTIDNKVTCSCPKDYVLEDLKTCVTNPCRVNNGGCSHTCRYINNRVQCSCPDHYNLINETVCSQVDPCFINNGGCSHTCISEDNQVYCLCPVGYELKGKKCVRINPCDIKNGGCSHVCSSINGQVICKCPPGHELIEKTCFKINPCKINNGGCPFGCMNVRGQAKCIRPRGSTLFSRKTKEDPCARDNGGCSHFCHNVDGKKECSCPPGYLLRPNKLVCKELNECKLNRGGCSHGCKNLPGSYKCTCPYGLELHRQDNKTCVDIDECRVDNGGCEMLCRNHEAGFRCECPSGYTLQRDQRSCRADPKPQCRVPFQPKNGVLKCDDQSSDYGSLVPTGTRCNVWCDEGYKLDGRSSRVCNSRGEWEGEEPRCLVATCSNLPPIQHGWYLPGICNDGRTHKGESCEVYCKKGFKRRPEFYRYRCSGSLEWDPPVAHEHLQEACIRDVPTTYIRCPSNGFLDFTLPLGQNHMFVRIPRPETNVEFERFVTAFPSWATRLEAMLPVGRHEVTFTATDPNDTKGPVNCNLVVNILDKEKPRVNGCPENIERNLFRGENMQIIHWREPVFYDNVGVVNVYKSREPGTEFGPGLHSITYTASDEAGNRAYCYFSIKVKEVDSEESNSIQQQAIYTNHTTAGLYRALLICPSGVQYMSNSPDSYNNALTREAGCRWEHVRVNRPMQPQSFRLPMYSNSRLPSYARSNRRTFFQWNR